MVSAFCGFQSLAARRPACQVASLTQHKDLHHVSRVLPAIMPFVISLAMLGSVEAGSVQDTTPLNAVGKPRWIDRSVAEAARLRTFLQVPFQTQDGSNEESQPASSPRTLVSRNPQGLTTSYMPQGATASTATEPFFLPLGTNGRTCVTCHQPNAGWSITPRKIHSLFRSNPAAPLFQPIDGAVCPTADTSTAQATAAAYRLLINKGLIRVFIPMPATDVLQFSISSVSDPYHCTSDPAIGLTSPATGIVSAYRRPQPSANLPFLTTIMWDGREPSLASQAKDAMLIHAQAAAPPDDAQVDGITQFETGLFCRAKL